MEHFPISKAGSALHIDGIPDAVKVVALEGPKARRLADLYLHKVDLDFAGACLEWINKMPVDPHIPREALWRCAIIHYLKCFGRSEARGSLNGKKIFKGDPMALESHGYFLNLRDKHLVHDENAYAQALPGAALNDGTKPYKVEKIVSLAVMAATLGQGNYGNLSLLIKKVRDWIVGEYDRLCVELTEETERLSFEKLWNRESLRYRAPTVSEIAARRP